MFHKYRLKQHRFGKYIVTCKNHNKLTVSTNGGLKIFDKKATLELFPMTVHFNQNYMSTILLFKEVAYTPGVRITTDTNKKHAMTATLKMESFQVQEVRV